MRIALSDARVRWLFLALVAFAAIWFSCLSAKLYLAAHWNESADPNQWRAAARLEPGNARYWEHIGLYNQWNLEHRNLPEAIHDLQRAAKIDPRAEHPWMELADAEEMQGEVSRARQAYEMAQSDDPISPSVAWRYGSFLLREEDFREGFAELRRALTVEPLLEASAISECWAADPEVSAIVDQLLPQTSDSYIRAINYFVSHKQARAALVVWGHLWKSNQPFAMASTVDLVNELIHEDRMRDARNVWKEALQATGWPHSTGNTPSMIFNGGFEQDFLDGGFDWRESRADGVSYAFDDGVSHTGRRSLRVSFDGTANINFQNIFQYAAVEPRCRYRFAAFLRTEAISTDSGIRFEIFDPRHPAEVQTWTPSLRGTNPWTRETVNVESGPETHLLEILLRRTPSSKFDNKLRGIVWVDDISLIPIQEK